MGMFFSGYGNTEDYDEIRHDSFLMNEIITNKYKDSSLFSKIDGREVTDEDIDMYLSEEMS